MPNRALTWSAAFALSPLLLYAQSTDASLTGSVVDASQGTIPSATVSISNVRTDDNGIEHAVNHIPVDRHLGSVQRTGNGVVFLGNLQIPDPRIQSIASATVRSRSTLRAIRVGDENGPILMSNPVPGQLGTMNQRTSRSPSASSSRSTPP